MAFISSHLVVIHKGCSLVDQAENLGALGGLCEKSSLMKRACRFSRWILTKAQRPQRSQSGLPLMVFRVARSAGSGLAKGF
jgi:hypothetical protein